MLIFYLIDPAIRILSTANIAPQQSHWLIQLLRSMSSFNILPPLVFNKTMNFIDFPMAINEAKQHREKLMEERETFIDENNTALFCRKFHAVPNF